MCVRVECTCLTSLSQEAVLAAAEDHDLSEFDADGDGYLDALTFLHSGQAAEAGDDDCWGAVRCRFRFSLFRCLLKEVLSAILFEQHLHWHLPFAIAVWHMVFAAFAI